MTTTHIYKIDCFGSSRVMLQTNWDQSSAFLHRPGKARKTGISETVLNIRSLLRLCLSPVSKSRTLVFHSQSSLPYLLTALVVVVLRRDQKTNLIYDIHDLHERVKYFNFVHWLRYGILRHTVLGLCEAMVFSNSRISKMTVSDGLARSYAARYRSAPPVVVHSAPPSRFTAAELAVLPRNDRALIYFGTRKHLPLEMIDQIAEAGLELHLFGRDITREAVEVEMGRYLPDCVKIFGEYHPDQIDFLKNYSFVLLFKSDNLSQNYCHALPNKLFQGLQYGCSFIISSNFEEIAFILADTPGAVLCYQKGASFSSYLTKAKALRGHDFFDRLTERTQKFHDTAAQRYINLTRS